IDSLATPELHWQLSQGEHTLASGPLSGEDRLLALRAGRYRLTLDAQADQTGRYRLRLLGQAQALPLIPNQTLAGQLPAGAAAQLYRLD
ncbi:hypothetical protein, partial [Parachitinimonas caeni]